VRNQQFILTKDINTFKGSGWKLSGTSLPANTIGFRVSGGHDNPIFYLYASDGTVWKGSGSSWQKLNVKGKITDAQPWPQQNVVGTMSQIGLFVNPYQANTIYCLTNEGVYYSFDGGNSFSKDDILTSLVTDNNSYPITANYQGFTNFNPLIGFAGFPARCTISAVAFNRQQPDEVVVASSFSGLFYRKDKTSAWVNLTDKLPTPYCPITGASLTNDGIYVAFRGRGVVKLLSKK
jgi:hypothetical protein